jgi:hypothetical protein
VRDHGEAPRRESIAVRVRQVRRRCRPTVVLPLPAPPLDDDDAGVACGDDVELPRIEQRGDLGEVAVQRLAAGGRGAQHAARRTRRRVLAARERVRRQVGALPGRRAVRPPPHTLRARDAQEHAVLDGQRAAGDDVASTSRSPKRSS